MGTGQLLHRNFDGTSESLSSEAAEEGQKASTGCVCCLNQPVSTIAAAINCHCYYLLGEGGEGKGERGEGEGGTM